MKKLSIGFFLFLAAAIQLSAQQETLFNKAKVWGLWAGPLVELNAFDKDFNNSYGGGAGLVVGQFFIGGYGLGSSDIEDIINEENYKLDLGHGGLWLGYTYKPYKLIHPYTSVKIGWGVADFDLEELEEFDPSINDFDQVTVITPELGVELNVTSFFHIAATAGYRYVNGISSASNIGKNDLNNFNVGLTFRFGWFGNWSRHHRNCD